LEKALPPIEVILVGRFTDVNRLLEKAKSLIEVILVGIVTDVN